MVSLQTILETTDAVKRICDESQLAASKLGSERSADGEDHQLKRRRLEMEVDREQLQMDEAKFELEKRKRYFEAEMEERKLDLELKRRSLSGC